MLKVCLTHDIDRITKSYQYISKLIRSIGHLKAEALRRQYASLMTKRPYWGFDRLIEVENQFAVKSTIFFLNESIRFNPLHPKTLILSQGRYKIDNDRIVQTIRYLDDNGWEIGVHGSYNSYNSLGLLIREKHRLERIVGHEVRGIRQHYLNHNEDTWHLQSKAGFRFDSSLGYTDETGFMNHSYAPQQPFADHFVVFPLAIMDMCFVHQPQKWELFERITSACEENDAVLVINFHQHVFHDPDFPGWGDDYIKIIEKCLAKNASFKTMGQYYDEIACRHDIAGIQDSSNGIIQD